MSTAEITPEEAAALTPADSTPAQAGVQPRDFSQPKRLSAEQLEELRVKLSLELGPVARTLRPWFRAEHPLALDTVSEVSFHGLLGAAGDKVCAASFQVGETVGWLLWDLDAALAATARAMGVEPSDEAASDDEDDDDETPPPDRLSPVEASIASRFLGELLGALGKVLGFHPVGCRMIQSREELEHSIVQQRGTDAQRLRVDLSLDGPGGDSTLRLYLPGVVPRGDSARGAAKEHPALPEHLAGVALTLSAEFDPIELPLDELLALEVGDVIALTTRLDDPINLTIEELGCAKARLGRHEGQLAVRLESLTLEGPKKETRPK